MKSLVIASLTLLLASSAQAVQFKVAPKLVCATAQPNHKIEKFTYSNADFFTRTLGANPPIAKLFEVVYDDVAHQLTAIQKCDGGLVFNMTTSHTNGSNSDGTHFAQIAMTDIVSPWGLITVYGTVECSLDGKVTSSGVPAKGSCTGSLVTPGFVCAFTGKIGGAHQDSGPCPN